MRYYKLIISLIVLLIFQNTFANIINEFNCYSILVGKDCTVDGSVLFAHNEDDYGEQIVNMYKVPSLNHDTNEVVILKNGGVVPQIPVTNRYLWLDMPGMNFSDSYMNEFGVTIASNSCHSKEKNADLKNGGIGYWLRRLMAERAKSAREAVEIGGKLIEEFGYNFTGRTYCIADPKESWVMSVVMGNQWIAQRVPDNKIMVLPNYFTITNININDTENYLISEELIEFAIKEGWYTPEKDSEFNFRQVYGINSSIEHPNNINRKWSGLNLLGDKNFKTTDEFPFLIAPKKKITVKDLMKVLRNHYENTELENNDLSVSVHENKFGSICAKSTQYGFVAQLNGNMPKEIGNVFWYSPIHPCTNPFIPIFYNIKKFPKDYYFKNYQSAIKTHFTIKLPEIKKKMPEHAFLSITNKNLKIEENYYSEIRKIKKKIKKYEKNILKKHSSFQKRMLKLHKKNPKKARMKITDYSMKNLEFLKNFHK